MGVFDGIRRRLRQGEMRKAVAALRRLTVGEIMTSYVITCHPQDTVITAATKMIAEDVSCLLAMDGDALKGILSERDFSRKVPLNKKVFKMQVKDIMTPNVVTVPPEMGVVEGVALMKERKFRRLVVAKDGKVLGLVTQTDFSKRIAAAFTCFPASERLRIDGIISPPVIVNKETFSVARDKMKASDVGAAIIAKSAHADTIQGFFSEYDIVMQFYDQHGELRIKELTNFIRKYVRAIPTGMSVFEANALLLEKRIHRLPVITNDRIVGILTQTEIIRFVYTNLDLILQEAMRTDVPLVCLRKGVKHDGEFRGEHLKMYAALAA